MPQARPSPTLTASEDADLGAALSARVAEAAARGEPLRLVGGGSKDALAQALSGARLDLSGHRGILDYAPSELVMTARAGTPLAQIEAALARSGQRLAFEPPIMSPASTLGGVVAAGLSGARRPFAGGVRDAVLGVKILDGRGRILRFGGTVFKNVAGFDAFRLMAGAYGCLGVLLEVSLRVAPAPQTTLHLAFEEAWPRAKARLEALLRRPVPVTGAVHDGAGLLLRLEGPDHGVRALAAELGGVVDNSEIWEALRQRRYGPHQAARLWRVLIPRRADTAELEGLAEAPLLRDWAGAEIWLASEASADRVRDAARRIGGHAALHRGARAGEAVFPPLAPAVLALHQRLKRALDPAGVLNPGRLYQEL